MLSVSENSNSSEASGDLAVLGKASSVVVPLGGVGGGGDVDSVGLKPSSSSLVLNIMVAFIDKRKEVL